MNVMKFGGTSVGSPQRMKEVAAIIDRGENVVVVLSAVSGTTNKLVDIGHAYSSNEKQKALDIINVLQSSYSVFLDELFSTNEGKTAGTEIIQNHFDLLRSFSRNGFGVRQYKEILAQGEMISTQLFFQYMKECGKDAVLMNALDFMRIDEDGEPVMEQIKRSLAQLLSQNTARFVITQGFICRNPLGEIDNLKRGGSDYSASLIGAAIGADEIQIWTDIDGMHNNDPRIVEGTFPVRQLSFDEAAELAYFGAKILHPSSVNPARSAGIPVRLKNTMKPDAPGTLIAEHASEPGTIKAIAAKDGIIAIRIVSNRMFLAYGFLRRVFEIFERYKTPIDMITTSEVAVSLTIDQDVNLDQILSELNEIASVEIDRDLSIVCVVGDNLESESGFAGRILAGLQDLPVRMVSCGGSKNNVSLLIASSNKNHALNLLNSALFTKVTA